MRDLRSGKYADTTEIAQQFELNDAHVRRILRFGYLAPDIVEAIVEDTRAYATAFIEPVSVVSLLLRLALIAPRHSFAGEATDAVCRGCVAARPPIRGGLARPRLISAAALALVADWAWALPVALAGLAIAAR